MPTSSRQPDDSQSMTARDEQFMGEALALARTAGEAGEVPVGAIIVRGDIIIGRGYNQPIQRHDPTAHAEVIALRGAAFREHNYRLPGCELYVTLEPCAMCAGAIMHARIGRLVFGARDPKTGACGSVANLFTNEKLNHHAVVTGDVLGLQCGRLLSDFFAARRKSVDS